MLKRRFYFADDAAPEQPQPKSVTTPEAALKARVERVLKASRPTIAGEFNIEQKAL